MMNNVLEVNNITKIYSKGVITQALKGINISVKKREFIGVMGPSGSGKTTLLNIISTIDSPTSGTVLINGHEPHTATAGELALFRRCEMGIVFQAYNLMDTLTVKENMAMTMILDKKNTETIGNRIEELAETLGINEILDKYPYQISGGEAQRTAIGRAVANFPSILLADEPTGNLDSKASSDVMNLLAKLNSKEQVTLVLVTHDPFAASFCDRVVFIKDGLLHNEINKGESKKQFFNSILDTLSFLNEI